MCEVCSQRGKHLLCPACRARTGDTVFPLSRDTWNFGALWDYCFEAFKRDWLMLSVAVLVWLAVGTVANFLTNIASAVFNTDAWVFGVILMVVSFIVQTVVQGAMALGMLRVVFDVLEGGGVDIARLFSQFSKVGRYLVTWLLAVVMVALPLVLLFCVLAFVGLVAVGVSVGDVVGGQSFGSGRELALVGVFAVAGLLTFIPALYFGLPLYLMQAELTFNDDVLPDQALRNCYTLARGERLSIFGVSLFVGLLIVLGMLACCVGIFPALGLGQLMLGGLYLALRNGSELERG
jgi:uncharacterized membrane protein